METVTAAINRTTDPWQTFVRTSLGRWLLVENYPEEFHAAYHVRKDRTPKVENVKVVREATEDEFYACCSG